MDVWMIVNCGCVWSKSMHQHSKNCCLFYWFDCYCFLQLSTQLNSQFYLWSYVRTYMYIKQIIMISPFLHVVCNSLSVPVPIRVLVPISVPSLSLFLSLSLSLFLSLSWNVCTCPFVCVHVCVCEFLSMCRGHERLYMFESVIFIGSPGSREYEYYILSSSPRQRFIQKVCVDFITLMCNGGSKMCVFFLSPSSIYEIMQILFYITCLYDMGPFTNTYFFTNFFVHQKTFLYIQVLGIWWFQNSFLLPFAQLLMIYRI